MEAIKNLVGQLGPKRLMLMGGVAFALLAALAFVATRGSDPQMGYLYTDLDPSAAATITEKLKAQNVEYQLSADGTSVMAPQDKLAELRMSLAGEKLGGKIGYEVLDEEQPFGVSASRAKMNETRAVEGELSKSIQTIQNVSAARVHIVMPERAMFAAESRKATAAVTVKTKGRLSSEQIASIRYLVSSSVPELSPEAVSVVDQTGALLARAGEAGLAGGADADERQQAVEAKLREEVEALLEPIVGQGKVRAEVSAQIDRDQTREESNLFDPDKQVISRQVSVENGEQNSEQDAGAQTASVGNQLPEAQGQAPGAATGNGRQSRSNQTSEDTTYDNSSTKTVTLRGPGKVTRLTVAVMVDGGEKGLPQPQMQRLQRLVENAVGMDAERGDSVVVESMRFANDDSLADKDSGFFSQLPMDRIWGLLQIIVIGAVGLIALRMLKPKIMPQAPVAALEGPEGEIPLSAQSPEMLALAERAADGDADAMQKLEAMNGDQPLLDQEIALAQVDGRIKLSALKRIGDAIHASPPEAASVIRQWMNS
ncbi:flagellar basal-body MS-ring/collar protein FliF [Sphingomonas sp. 7/4-4]|uniref:flagellar basal-body MS-ring/collar protein FliF n=1 Tax=Sphingomonas sp. 7/4-4 TaxID=3018446 RepID=UPI0022F3C133|nr:flagellar basal-body MS-ring/collar protein FliF [Sphingomonas sp. 7/4-4]WBY09450.1 flagellar basal-body MS-ring/collar protein FliF [Sphingomonas sp. 7/4-4]